MLPPEKKKKINPVLATVLLVSGGLHVLGLLVLGGIVVYNYVVPEEKTFEAAETLEEEPPPPPRPV